ncbi:MAG: hypothetical protein KIT71_03340 [Nitrospira sp.]|nr:hypothetical protein [Nitrospira sp.]
MARHSFVFQEQPRGKTFNRSRIIGRVACLLWITLGLAVSVPAKALALDWVPTDQEIQKYRQSWNPLSNGPIFISGVDVHPQGQFTVHPFIFSQISEKQFGNDLTTNSTSSPVHSYQIAPVVTMAYGLTNHLELNVGLSGSFWWANSSAQFNQGKGGPWTTDSGVGDTQIYLKYRPIVQDPDGWRPSITTFNMIVLPTSKWAGTESPPGGFAPLGRLPASRFGSLTWTEGILARKNLAPFRVSAGVFYSYHLPGSQSGETTYPSDIINTRLIIEHILDEKRGFGYNLELVGFHGLTWRADGHQVTTGGKNGFNTFGVQPTLQYRLGDHWVGAAGVLFTVAGQNTQEAIFPNFSIYYYWGKNGTVIMR